MLTAIVTQFISKGLEAGGDPMLFVFYLLIVIFRIKSCVFHFQVKSEKLGYRREEGSNLCNTAVIFDYILKTINDHFVLIS